MELFSPGKEPPVIKPKPKPKQKPRPVRDTGADNTDAPPELSPGAVVCYYHNCIITCILYVYNVHENSYMQHIYIMVQIRLTIEGFHNRTHCTQLQQHNNNKLVQV